MVQFKFIVLDLLPDLYEISENYLENLIACG